MPGGVVPNVPNAIDLFGSAPGTPTDPNQLLAIRRPGTPTVFSVSLSDDGTYLIFIVGSNQVSLGRFNSSIYNIFFAPMSGSNQAAVANIQTAVNFFQGALLVDHVSANPLGGTVTVTNTRFATEDGWFWAQAVNSQGNSSDPTLPIRAPAFGSFINNSIPPIVSNVSVSKTSVAIGTVTVSRIKVQATAPSNGTGVTSVVVTGAGSGYTAPPTVTFSGGLQAGGTQATANAIINSLGEVTAIILSSAGSGYISAPAVTLSAPGGGGTTATAGAFVGTSTAFDGFQIYLTNYRGGAQVEGPYFNAGGAMPGQVIFGTFDLIPDSANTTTFTFVSVSRAGRRSLSGAPTATLIV